MMMTEEQTAPTSAAPTSHGTVPQQEKGPDDVSVAEEIAADLNSGKETSSAATTSEPTTMTSASTVTATANSMNQEAAPRSSASTPIRGNGTKKSHENEDGTKGSKEAQLEQNGGTATDVSQGVPTNENSTQKSNQLVDVSIESPKESHDSSTLTSSTSKASGGAVDPDRKQVLLAEARQERLEWIERVPLPYRSLDHENEITKQQKSSKTTTYLHNTHVAQYLPSALQILMGLDDVITEDIDSSLDDNSIPPTAVPTGMQKLRSAIHKYSSQVNDSSPSSSDKETLQLLREYQNFLFTLRDPVASPLVQGMKGFCRNFQDVDDLASAVERLHKYIESTHKTMQASKLWNSKDMGNINYKRFFETQIYGHCDRHIRKLIWDQKAIQQMEEWNDRLEKLQFITAKHLEIQCLVSVGSDDDNTRDVLNEASQVLLSVDRYFSPYEKLQRILKVYHEVNAALTVALNRQNTNGESKKLPSADDILPSLILVVLHAKPKYLRFDLQFIEHFCAQEYLRGEAGYAYTNVYGAVQFLVDIDFKGEPKNISISPEEFREGLEKCKIAAETRLSETRRKTIDLNDPSSVTLNRAPVHMEGVIPVKDIREARMKGMTPDMSWALKKYHQVSEREVAAIEELSIESGEEAIFNLLPEGFSRTYSYLNARPEDIKLSDLPDLLAEYRMLVQTTEILIGENVSRIASERKERRKLAEREVYARAKEFDPSLLPTNRKKKSSKENKPQP